MQCNTMDRSRQVDPRSVTDLENWDDLVQSLPDSLDLEATARSTGALIRRREIRSASDLLRLVVGYAVCDWSLRLLAMHYLLWGLGFLSHVALRKRLQHCGRWLRLLIGAVLQARLLRVAGGRGLQLEIQDASVICQPGSQGTDWRVHALLDIGQTQIADITLTDKHGGESLRYFPAQPNAIRLVDAGYAHASGIGPFLQAKGQLVVRINWQNLPLQDEQEARFDLIGWLRALEQVPMGPQEQIVWLSTPQGRFRLRLLACPLPPEKAEEARRRARQAAKKKKHQVDARTLLAAGFVLLITNLPASDWPVAEVLGLYRVRWQVELLFKRLKSLLHWDHLRAQDPALAEVYLLGKILGALLLENLQGQLFRSALMEWEDLARPISPWKCMAFFQQVLQQLIRGNLTVETICQTLPRLRRYMADEPRRRCSQLASAQHLLHVLSGC